MDEKRIIEIGICDDQKSVHAQVRELCRSAMVQEHILYRMYSFPSGEELLAFTTELDILLLDVEMPEMDGFAVAQELNKREKDIKIIFLTNYDEITYINKAFEVKAYRYIPKSFAEELTQDTLMEAVKEVLEVKYIWLDQKGNKGWIKGTDILYLEGIGDEVAIHLKNEIIVSRKTLKSCKDLLGEDFYMCHKSYIVKLSQVKALKDKNLILRNGEEIPVSKRNKTSMKKIMLKYLEQKGHIW